MSGYSVHFLRKRLVDMSLYRRDFFVSSDDTNKTQQFNQQFNQPLLTRHELMTRRNVGLVELLVELVEHHGILILHVVVSRVMFW